MHCVPYATYHRDRSSPPIISNNIFVHLYTQPLRPTAMAIYEDVQLKHLAEELELA